MFAIPPFLHVNYRVQEPHVSHTGINVCAHCPLHLPKKVSKKPSVNHIGSSTSHQQGFAVADPGFPRGGGANPKGGHPPIIWPVYSENCTKMKKLWAGGGHASPAPPLRSATVLSSNVVLP